MFLFLGLILSKESESAGFFCLLTKINYRKNYQNSLSDISQKKLYQSWLEQN